MSYLKKKRNRQRVKYSNILMKDFGIVTSDVPTQIIAICNGGLCNGITHEMVTDVFSKYDKMDNIVMVPGKSYCFIRFNDSISAELAFNEVNGQIIWTKIKGPVFICFINDFNMNTLQSEIVFENPPGLILIEDFITEEEERSILNVVGFGDEHYEISKSDTNSCVSELKHRRVKHYGYEFKYSTNNVDLNEPIEKLPSILDFLWERLKKQTQEQNNCIEFLPDQLTINCYEPGQGIPPHVDTHSAFEDGILSLSLQSSIVMEFKHESGKTLNVILKRRSLCLMLGESRYDWTHSITPRKSDLIPNNSGLLTVQNRGKRTSLTFRKTRNGECNCKYPRLCDSVLAKLKDPDNPMLSMKNMNLGDVAASELEGSYVHGVYEKIADHFSDTRHKPWPNVFKFINSFEKGSIVLDVGCGNGKYFSQQINRFELGCDSTAGLMKICRKRGFECFSCNCLNLPLRDNIVDGCICIAVIHHLTTEERRRRAIEEMIRVLRSKGKALIYVWAKNQVMEGKKSSYLKYKCQKDPHETTEENVRLEKISLDNSQQQLILPVHNNRTGFGHNDLLVPWKLKSKGRGGPTSDDEAGKESVYLRFYHVYEDHELKYMCENISGANVIDYYYDQGNWCVVLEKN